MQAEKPENNLNFLFINFLKFDIDKAKIKQVLILVPLHRENITSYLSPILGQYAIRNVDFINTFIEQFNKDTNSAFSSEISTENADTTGISDLELTVPVKLSVYKGGKYSITTHLPHIGFLYSKKFARGRRLVRNNKAYRNYPKLLQLSMMRLAALGADLKKANYTDNIALKKSYIMIRHALHKKR